MQAPACVHQLPGDALAARAVRVAAEPAHGHAAVCGKRLCRRGALRLSRIVPPPLEGHVYSSEWVKENESVALAVLWPLLLWNRIFGFVLSSVPLEHSFLILIVFRYSQERQSDGYIIVLDQADRLRDHPPAVASAFLKLQELVGVGVKNIRQSDVCHGACQG